MRGKGKVYLVGAGPGSPDLLTIRAWKVLEKADVVLYDQLAGGVRDLLPKQAELINCGKSGSRHTMEQDEIERTLVEKALEGKQVVRLKGGDPFLFGRGGEELEALQAAGVPVELVPGVTSAIAVPGCVGIPVTHREHASEVVILTGHEDPGKEESTLDWDLLAKFRGTIVILMGVKNLSSIASRLVARGKDPETPVAIIERGLEAGQRVTTGPLGKIGELGKQAGIRPPAVIVIGGVVGLYREEDLCGAM
ncbi:MAG: uroporphyrinogen-III C-methyltransferase [Methanomicrobiales archaeon]|nr:uroporphyrinogen-III C-methyltransferase [Methanomicrobiales archaeon]